MALRSLLRRTPGLGCRRAHPILPAAGFGLMSKDYSSDSVYYSQQVLARQRENIDRLRADYDRTREKLNQDMDALLERMSHDSDRISTKFRRLSILEKAFHVLFLGSIAAAVLVCLEDDKDLLVPGWDKEWY